MMGIWQDDAPMSVRRKVALDRLMELCPSAMRMAFRPMVEMAIANAPDEHIMALSADVNLVKELAEKGDVEGIATVARKYGATDQQVNAYLPMFTSLSH